MFASGSGAFVDWFGRDHASLMRLVGDELWYPKANGPPEVLAYLLGRGELNIAEVRPAPPHWGMGPKAAAVRIAQQYTPGELPITDLDAAVASELVFSLWIRRRDTHAFNSVFVAGIPMFFDHHIAFAIEEPENRDLSGFFKDRGPGGSACRWRIVQVAEGIPLVTGAMRRINHETGYAIHGVRSPERFEAAVDEWVDRIASRDLSDVESVVLSAGYRRADVEWIAAQLRDSQDELPAVAWRLRELASEIAVVY